MRTKDAGIAARGMQATTLFFDLDDTVMCNPFRADVFPVICNGIAAASDLTEKEALSEIIEENRMRLAHPPRNRESAMDWDDIVRTVAGRHGIEPSRSVTELVSRFAAPPHTSILDDAPAALAALRQDGRRKLIASSMGLSRYQFPVLRALGLYPLFDDFLMPDIVGLLKTDPNYYDRFLTSPSPGVLIAIGDKYSHDILPPKLQGIMAILVARIPELESVSPFARPAELAGFCHYLTERPTNFPLLPDAVAINLSELPEIIQQMEQRSCGI